jgi:hypothetical protein
VNVIGLGYESKTREEVLLKIRFQASGFRRLVSGKRKIPGKT